MSIIINPNTEIVISPTIIVQLVDNLDPEADETLDDAIQEIIDRAKLFINRFSTGPFLINEPIHEFVGLEFRDADTGLVSVQYRYRLIVRPQSIGIFTTDEVPIDDMYDIRHVIAEAAMPEYQ